ncbi:MAG TPA: right-handed parallel beta-helix repeat-containing protein [Saprospiraceae bacterium]|nr:right-handed parallel beta-helix repeat-containing protein [Saprospiraceae bacterium]
MSASIHNIITFIICFLFMECIMPNGAMGQTLHVGSGYPYETLTDATDIAIPGDTIRVHEGTYTGGIFIADLQGLPTAWIYILAAEGETVIFDGGSNAWQFSDAAYLYIAGFIFEHQTGNGVNFDDGGTYDTPAHHITFENCSFQNINATGNNDLLKLSGLDDFLIVNCSFLNGAEGGSGIDMVGCHDGSIRNCHFEDLGSNSIQAKGGTRNIRIERNIFKNGGARAVNLGGSTGLPFFRPIDAPYEAADLKVYSNIFIGSEASVAFVGCINTEVVNNSIFLPEKWVMRILQETVDPTRFPPCGNNTFRNNIVYLDNRLNTECNIGPDTAPETFTFSNNLWYQSDDINWGGPDLPVIDVDQILNEDPLFTDVASDDFTLLEGSPAIGQGFDVTDPLVDYAGEDFLDPRSIGAFEGGMVTGTENVFEKVEENVLTWPNPANGFIYIKIAEGMEGPFHVNIFNADGKAVYVKEAIVSEGIIYIDIPQVPFGNYVVEVKGKKENMTQAILFK